MLRKDDAVFVDVDTQHDFMDEGGALYVPNAETIKPNLRRLTEFAERKGIPILSSVDAHVEDDPEFDIFPPHCVKGTEGQRKIPETTAKRMIILPNEKVDGLSLSPGVQIVLEKRVYSLFDNVNSSKLIKSSNRRTFVVYGVATDYCVRAAAEGLLKRGYEVYLVVDAIKGITKEGEKQTLEYLRSLGAKEITTEDIIKSLS